MKKFFVLFAMMAFFVTASAQEAATGKTCTKAEKAKCAKTCTKAQKAACAKSGKLAVSDELKDTKVDGKFMMSEELQAKLVSDGYDVKSCPMSGSYATKTCSTSGSTTKIAMCTSSGTLTKAYTCGKSGKVEKTAVTMEDLMEGQKVVKEAKVKGTANLEGNKKAACSKSAKKGACCAKKKAAGNN